MQFPVSGHQLHQLPRTRPQAVGCSGLGFALFFGELRHFSKSPLPWWGMHRKLSFGIPRGRNCSTSLVFRMSHSQVSNRANSAVGCWGSVKCPARDIFFPDHRVHHLDPSPDLETSPGALKATILGRQDARTAKTSRDPSARPEKQLSGGHSKPMVTPFFARAQFDRCILLH